MTTTLPKNLWLGYLSAAIIYSALAVLTGVIILLPELIARLNFIWWPVILSWSLINLALLIVLVIKKSKRDTLLLPSLYVFDYILSYTVGTIAGAKLGGAAYHTPWVAILLLIIPAATLGIAIYQLSRNL